ncbi:MAG: hypothetical protein V1859_08745 [archaeon]
MKEENIDAIQFLREAENEAKKIIENAASNKEKAIAAAKNEALSKIETEKTTVQKQATLKLEEQRRALDKKALDIAKAKESDVKKMDSMSLKNKEKAIKLVLDKIDAAISKLEK